MDVDAHGPAHRASGRPVGEHASRHGSTRRRPVIRLLAGLIVASALMGVILVGPVLPVVAAGGWAVTSSSAFFDDLPNTLPESQLPRTSVILAGNGAPLAYLYTENRTPVSLDRISPVMQHAIVAIEDSRYYQHGAVDPKGVIRAVVNNSAGGDTEGASTLTQQYVKNLLVETAAAAGDKEAARAAVAQTTGRKVREMRLAMTAEQQWTKDEILERYLNIVYFGQGSYGVEAAARRYFGVPAAKLDLARSALLAGLVQDPSRYDPVRHPDAARARRDVVLVRMRQQGLITPAEFAKASAEKVVLTGSALPNGCVPSTLAGFFCDYVVRSLERDPAYRALGATPEERSKALRTGGLVVRTTLDVTAQDAAVKAVHKAIPATDSSGLGTSSVTVEAGTGRVIAMAENRIYAVSGGKGKTSVNYGTDTALGGSSGFQTGSSFKPFTLATWLATGHSLDDTVDATQRTFNASDFTACGRRLRGPEYEPGNAEGHETGEMTVLKATEDSVNVAYVDMETQLDLCVVARLAERLGVHLAAPEQECSADEGPTSDLPTCLPSLTLGVKNIAPLTMAAAYAGFATGGVYCEPLPVTGIARRQADGSFASVGNYRPTCTRALDPKVASGVNQALSKVLTEGTAASVGAPGRWPAAGKTGTTDGPYDTWFVGYTAQRSTAVWVGDPGTTKNGTAHRRRLTGITVDGRRYGVVYGASIAAPIWKDVTTAVMKGLKPTPLP